MKLSEVRELLSADVICCEDQLDREAVGACASDMMSDVLALGKSKSVLITGLLNPQVVRTAEMMDMICIVFVRKKKPDSTIIRLAKDRDIVLMSTDFPMYQVSGTLYSAGLGGEV
jgi:hypothetical protein